MAYEQHYVDAAKLYDKQVFYDLKGPLVQWQLEQVLSKLSLGAGTRLVDIGGGTGIFTLELVQRSGCSAVLVEPAPEMIKQAEEREGGAGMRCVCDSLQGFLASSSGSDERFDRVMLKEVAHHIPEDERTEAFTGLAALLEPGGKLLILTRPHNPDYPLFTAARAEWQKDTPAAFHPSLEDALRAAGLQVETTPEAFPMALPKSVWYDMVRQKFWSCFANLSDEQLEAGIAELEEKGAASQEEFNFKEVELFIVATKPLGGDKDDAKAAASGPCGGAGCVLS